VPVIGVLSTLVCDLGVVDLDLDFHLE